MLCLLPVLLPDLFQPSPHPPLAPLFAVIAWTIPLAALAFSWRLPIDLDRANRLALFTILAASTLALVVLHHLLVDRASYFAVRTNDAWQELLHRRVLELRPDFTPHSYRFLPDGFVRWIERFTGSFRLGRTIYRVTFTFLLLLAIYRYARRFLAHRGALLVLILYGAVYPASIRHYAGQLADPMSHLSFVLCLLFIDTDFALFATTLTIGVLAKETVAVMALAVPLFDTSGRRWRHAASAIYLAAVMVVGVRLLVTGRHFRFLDVSGVGPRYFLENLGRWREWLGPTAATIGLFVPLVALGWQQADRRLRRAIAFLGPVLFGSTLLFGNLKETRNLMPLVVPLAVASVAYLGDLRRQKLAE